ncbi:MAG: hypothetical protein MI754_13770, partial [Chromatiales bacterium]|nr:hypothetical protein [Chromatiales bacterium]
RWIELNVLDYTLAQHEYLQRQKAYHQAKQQQTEQRRALSEAQTGIEQANRRRQGVHDQLVNLEAQRMGVDALKQKDELERARDQQSGLLVEQGKVMLQQDIHLQEHLTHCREIKSILPEVDFEADLETATLARQVLKQGQPDDIDLRSLLQKDLTGDLAALEKYLDRAYEVQSLHNHWVAHWHELGRVGETRSLRDQLARLDHDQSRHYEQLTQQHKQKSHEIERLQNARVSYPGYVERALEVIRQRCPAADPRVLCDHVEVKDARWQSAIEGYLGGARFSILVEEAYEAEAIRIVRSLPGRDNRARIIQGSKAMRDTERMGALDQNSVIHVLEFSHATARHYLTASYGTVLRVDSAETLRHTRRGLTDDGMASGNYSMWRCDLPDSELVFGAAARERALQAKQAELQNIEKEWQQANDRMQRSSALLKAVDGLKPLGYADSLDNMLQTHRELQRLELLLDQLDLGEHKALEQRLQALKEQELALSDEEGALRETVGDIKRQLATLAERCKKLSDQQEENRERVENREENLRAITAVWPDFDSDARLNLADQEADELEPKTAHDQRQEIETQLHGSERRMNEAIQAHNQRCRPGDAIVYLGFEGAYDSQLFDRICGLQREIDSVYNILKNNILVEKHA